MPPTEVIWTAALALASAAVLMAYRHPRQYRFFVMVHLGGAIALLSVAVLGYIIGFVRGRDELVAAWVRDERVMADHQVVQPDGLQLLFPVFLVWLFLMALVLLPRIGFVSKDGSE